MIMYLCILEFFSRLWHEITLHRRAPPPNGLRVTCSMIHIMLGGWPLGKSRISHEVCDRVTPRDGQQGAGSALFVGLLTESADGLEDSETLRDWPPPDSREPSPPFLPPPPPTSWPGC